MEPVLDQPADRKSQRAQLIATRASLTDRENLESSLQRRVADWLSRADLHALGFYFPIHGEPDLRPVVAAWLAADTRRVAALPVINGKTLEFHSWTLDAPMQGGSFGIPVPAQGRVVQPECLMIPCLAFDAGRYRLGYGGGYYDRTLAELVPYPLAVGIAFEASRLESIGRRPHDVKMDVVITDAATY